MYRKLLVFIISMSLQRNSSHIWIYKLNECILMYDDESDIDNSQIVLTTTTTTTTIMMTPSTKYWRTAITCYHLTKCKKATI